MDMSDPVKLLLAVAQERKTVLGSQLGAALFNQFPQLKQTSGFGSLRSFIQTHCGNRLIHTGEHKGADDIYQFVAEGEMPPASSPSLIPNPWAVFQRPNVGGILAIENKTGQIRLLDDIDTLTGDEALLRPVTSEEHKGIARQFLEVESSLPDNEELEAILQIPNYWPKWSKLINSSGYKSLWTTFRINALREIFYSRCTEIGLSSDVAKIAFAKLSTLRSYQSKNTNPPASKISNRIGTNLRESMHKIIDQLSEEELRRIWLPIGLSSDILKFE